MADEEGIGGILSLVKTKMLTKASSMTRRKSQIAVTQGDMDQEALNIFFSRLRERRVELGLSQARLGESVGMSRAMVGFLENGSFPRDPARVAALARALGVSTDWLFGLE